MFTIECPSLGEHVIIWRGAITALTRTGHGTATEFRCACGAFAVCLPGEGPTTGRLVYHDTAAALALTA